VTSPTRALSHAVLLLGATLMLLPFVWMISTSLKPPYELFTVPPTWRQEFLRRLQAKGVTVDPALYEQASAEIDRLLGNTVARLAFGDSTAKRRSVPDDTQLVHALQVLKQSASQKDLFIIAQREQANSSATAQR